MDIAAKKQLRTTFMNWLFKDTGGSENMKSDPKEFNHPSGLPLEKIDLLDVVQYLEGEDLIKVQWSLQGPVGIQLTHRGIVEMEAALTEPDQPTEHFVPIVNITHVAGSVVDSQIQQGSAGAQQTGTFQNIEMKEAQRFITEARKLLAEPGIAPEVKEECAGDLETMERELKRSEPRESILRQLGESIKNALITGLGSAVATGVLSSIPFL